MPSNLHARADIRLGGFYGGYGFGAARAAFGRGAEGEAGGGLECVENVFCFIHAVVFLRCGDDGVFCFRMAFILFCMAPSASKYFIAVSLRIFSSLLRKSCSSVFRSLAIFSISLYDFCISASFSLPVVPDAIDFSISSLSAFSASPVFSLSFLINSPQA